ncbi:MAG: hypothetical protein QXJ40_05670 [Candidatus Bathyarchaeia archaeon]
MLRVKGIMGSGFKGGKVIIDKLTMWCCVAEENVLREMRKVCFVDAFVYSSAGRLANMFNVFHKNGGLLTDLCIFLRV